MNEVLRKAVLFREVGCRTRQAVWLLLLLGGPVAFAEDKSGPAKISSIEFEGNRNFSAPTLLSSISLKTGELYRDDKLTVARRMLTSFYQNNGYLDAHVSTTTTLLRADSLRTTFSIREGPLFHFGVTHIEGLNNYPERTVFRELPYAQGDPFRRRDLFLTQESLYNLGLFDDIRISTISSSSGVVNIQIRLRERPTRTVGGGVGYGSEERQRLSLEYWDRNLFHRTYTLDLAAEYSAIWLETRAELLHRYIFGTQTQGRARSSWRREYREGYDLERILGRVDAGHGLWFKTFGDVGYRLQQTVTFNVAPEVAETTPGTSLISAVQAGLTRDNTDTPFFPTRGSRLGLNFERAGGIFGGDIHYNKVSARAAGYAKLAGPVVGAVQVRGGAVRPFSPSVDVPIFERFFTGGANSVRGYRERSVGPKDGGSNPLGGNHWAGASVEIRFPLVWKFDGAVFGDGGQVASTQGGTRLSLWKYSTGAGIRFVTPVGPLRLDYGYKLNPDADDEDLWRIHFSLGETF